MNGPEEPIAIVGMACRYPDADDPGQLWQAVLDQRRAFRRLPGERLNLEDYFDRDPAAVDKTYAATAAVLEGWQFDRTAFRIPGPVYRSTDPAHWLALETAGRALRDAGHPDGGGLKRDRVGVVIGNSLTGEVTRAATLRLRWPYVRRVLAAATEDAGLSEQQRQRLIERAQEHYLAPFPPVGEETLAGGLANTIAGRICNHFDFHGGGYTVDGACASSLLSIITACKALRDGSMDTVLAGGVDISLDPFELVGFAKTSALARGRMLVYDENSAGFIPGEGCGVLTLMRASDAREAGREVYAEIVGWGVSSDGRGGITRPEREGQLLALRRAYELAGIDPATVGLIEGHGTGTAVGDATELAALLELRRDATQPAALGSVKANIGHTKAASGVAGVIKATMSLTTGVLPPTTGCETPHPSLRDAGAKLRVPAVPDRWPAGQRLAGVSSMGFGGINAHVVLRTPPRTRAAQVEVRRPPARAEVIPLSGDAGEVHAALDRIARLAPRLSEAEFHDLAVQFGRRLPDPGLRVALVAASAEQLAERCARASGLLADLLPGSLRAAEGVFAGDAVAGRVTVLLPGQGAPVRPGPGAIGSHVDTGDLFRTPIEGEGTAVAQPAIYRSTIAALRWLGALGVAPRAAIGHSLGELAGLVWAGCLATEDGAELVAARGRVMSSHGTEGTGMVSVGADEQGARKLAEGTRLVVAARNGPRSHVLAGPSDDVAAAAERARRHGVHAVVLPVSHAFHSPAMADCVNEFKPCLQAVTFRAPTARLVSTVLGRPLTEHDDIPALLSDQLVAPVRFWDAVTAVLPETDLFCEAGPGNTLSALVGSECAVPVVTTDAGSADDRALAETAAALFVSCAAPSLIPLFADRASRPMDIWRDRVFLENPCGTAPAASPVTPSPDEPPAEPERSAAKGIPDVVRDLIAEATELDPALIEPGTRLLGDLHLTSLRITQLVVDAADAAGRERPAVPLITADTTVHELAAMIEELAPAGTEREDSRVPGVRPWLRCFAERLHRILPPEQDSRTVLPYRQTFVVDGHPLSGLAKAEFDADPEPGSAVLVYLPDPAAPEAASTLLAAANAAVGAGTLAAVTHGSALSGFLATLRQEHPEVGVTVLRVPATADGIRSAARHAVAEQGTWRELVLDEDGAVYEPAEAPLQRQEPGVLPFGQHDVLLVSGGGKGIGYACASALARNAGVSLGLLGRSDPEHDETLRHNLDTLRDAGVRYAYERADVTDPAAVTSAVHRLTARLGTITGLLHGSGVNEPSRLALLDEELITRHLAPKVTALRNLLAAVDAGQLRALVTFGSVIGRHGLAGEAHYALANGVLRAEAENLAGTLPGCRVLNLDWSVWEGAGMGERLGVLDALRRIDVDAIPVEDGTDIFLELLATPELPSTVTVHGRLGPVGWERTPGQWGDLLERVRVYYPGVELVAEADLDLGSTPYLADHRIDGLAVLPAVAGMEAMAQAASALAGRPLRHVAELSLERPIVVPDDGSRTIRVCALRTDEVISVVIRSDETDFKADHFAAEFPLALPAEPATWPELPDENVLLRADDLYGPLYFHTGPFELVEGFAALGARYAHALLRSRDTDGEYPLECAGSLLGDVIGNDATVHALQACVPHRRLLPVGCERFTRVPGTHNPREIYAVERSCSDGEYVWDVVALDQYEKRAITWTGLRLRDVGPLPRTRPWPPALLAVHLERSAARLGLDDTLLVQITGTVRGARGRGVTSILSRLRLNEEEPLTLRVWADAGAVCHWEAVESKSKQRWRRLVGSGFDPLLDRMRAQLGEDFPTLAARVWSVIECVSFIDYPPDDPVVLDGVYDGGWAVLRAGGVLVATTVVSISDVDSPVAIAILAKSVDGRTDAQNL